MSQSIRDAFKELDDIQDIDITYENHRLIEKVKTINKPTHRKINEHLRHTSVNEAEDIKSRRLNKSKVNARIEHLKQVLGISESCKSENKAGQALTEDNESNQILTIEDVRSWLEDGGVTLDVTNKCMISFDDGYQVSFADSEKQLKNIDIQKDEDVQKVMDEIQNRFESAKTPYTGLWVDEGIVYVDNSEWIRDEETAIEIGKDENQLAIWDWKNGDSIRLEYDTEAEESEKSEENTPEEEMETVSEEEPTEEVIDEPEIDTQETEEEELVDTDNKHLTADEIFDIVDRDLNGDDVAIQIGARVFICEVDALPENGIPEDETFDFVGCEVTADDIQEVDGKLMMQDCGDEKSYSVVNGKVSESPDISESLVESKKINLLDKQEVEEGKQFLENDNEVSEVIVDVDADKVDHLKKSYVGNLILRCPVCGELIYKDINNALKDEESNLYNTEEECPHCGSIKGFELVGQVSKPDSEEAEELENETNNEAEDNSIEDLRSEEEKELEQEIEPESEEEKSEEGVSKEEEDDVEFESLNTHSFNKLITEHLTRTYNNVSNFIVGNYNVVDNSLIVEGRITYKSGNIKPTKFVFEAKDNQLVGYNKQLTNKSDAFSVNYKLDNKSLIAESLEYSYKVNDTLIEGIIR